jgi:hypothetical protein
MTFAQHIPRGRVLQLVTRRQNAAVQLACVGRRVGGLSAYPSTGGANSLPASSASTLLMGAALEGNSG